MKKLFVTSILSLFFSFGVFAQAGMDLYNGTGCDLLFSVYEVAPGNCGTVQVHNKVIPAYSGDFIIASAAGNEFNRAVMSFVVNNCVGMNLANPSQSCMACPINYFLSSYTYTPNCNNACKKKPITLNWYSNCNGNGAIVVEH